MEWSFLFFFNSALLGVGLAMDAFSVSMANGLHDPQMSRRRGVQIAGTFAIFQAVMPMTGWVCVHTIVELFSSFEKFIPWIALALLGYIGFSVWNHANITCWGRRTLLLLVFGLVGCCFAAARDGLYKTIQNAIDGSCAPGLFPLVSIPTIVGCVGALLIIIAAIATPIAKTQHAREIWFYMMSGGAVLKIVTMEIARIIL